MEPATFQQASGTLRARALSLRLSGPARRRQAVVSLLELQTRAPRRASSAPTVLTLLDRWRGEVAAHAAELFAVVKLPASFPLTAGAVAQVPPPEGLGPWSAWLLPPQGQRAPGSPSAMAQPLPLGDPRAGAGDELALAPLLKSEPPAGWLGWLTPSSTAVTPLEWQSFQQSLSEHWAAVGA